MQNPNHRGYRFLAPNVANNSEQPPASLGNADRDIVTLGIATAALILFVGTGGAVMPRIVEAWFGRGAAPDTMLINAVVLNIALIIFGWRRYVDLQKEVAVRRKAEFTANELAQVDPLTGCLNRRSCCPAIDSLYAECAASRRDIAVLMIDFDNFKQINDLNGHKTGDMVLTEFSRRMVGLMPEKSVLARIGGDEFICALTFEHGRRETIDHFTNELIDLIAEPVVDGDVSIETTASVGIAHLGVTEVRSPDLDSDALLHRADVAMYHAKKRGRNRYYWFEAQMEDDLRFRNELEIGIRRGIPAGEFKPYYEQQIDIETGDLVGFEMLARWDSPQLGMLSPEVFIPVAEEINLIAPLSESLMRQAFVDAKDWDPSLTLSVNISPLQLRDPWFSQKLLRMLVDSGFPPNRLEIEITESCLHENLAVVRAIITSLRNQGVRISLDDFGTGYSSLAQLRSLPFDRLKIDRSFVTDLAEDGGNNELVRAIVSLGRGLSLPITAEGVESAGVLNILKGMGELKGQGYLYGMPENAQSTRKRLADLNLLKGQAGTEDQAAKDQAGEPEDQPAQKAG